MGRSLPRAHARIYSPSRGATQSGGGNRHRWVLEFEPTVRDEIEPLMGWVAQRDMLQQLRLEFPDLAAARTYAKREGLDYEIIPPPPVRPLRRSYADNFREPAETYERAVDPPAGGPSTARPR